MGLTGLTGKVAVVAGGATGNSARRPAPGWRRRAAWSLSVTSPSTTRARHSREDHLRRRGRDRRRV